MLAGGKVLSSNWTPPLLKGVVQEGASCYRAWGTQAWIDPVKGVAYVLMMQRSNFPNSDASDGRHEFQKAATTAVANGRAR